MSVNNGKDYLYLIWKSDQTCSQYIVGQLSKNGNYEFSYCKEVKKALDAGSSPLISFPDMNKVYSNDELFPVFFSRLPDKKKKILLKF